MKQTINFYQFQDSFKAIRPDNFSYNGLHILFDYLERLEEDTGEEIEFDVIDICCDYSEDTVDDIVGNYGIDIPDDMDKDDIGDYVYEYLENETMVAGVTDIGTIVYRVW